MIKVKTNPMKYKDSNGNMIDVGGVIGKEVTDLTLTKSNVPADSKTVGDKLNKLSQEIVDLKASQSQIEAPKIVSSVDEMTDTSKHYVLDGYIYHNKEVTIEGETTKTYPNQFVPSTASLNTRLSGSTGNTSNKTGYFTTDFIAVKDFTGVAPYNVRLNWEMPLEAYNLNGYDCKVVFYDSNKARCGDKMIKNNNASATNGSTVIDLCSGGGNTEPTASDVAYVRLQLCVNSSLSSVTSDAIANYEITLDAVYTETTTESTTTQQWVNSEIPYTPTFKTDLVGVLGEDNVIYLSDNLPSGTYTLKYPDNDYAVVGTISK